MIYPRGTEKSINANPFSGSSKSSFRKILGALRGLKMKVINFVEPNVRWLETEVFDSVVKWDVLFPSEVHFSWVEVNV